MSSLVIDVSVAVKWFLPKRDEDLVDQAMELLARYRDAKLRFLVPDLFWAEFGNVMWKAVRVGRCTREIAKDSIAEIKTLGLPTVPSQILIEQALSLALSFNRSVYDSLYVALAMESAAQLVTADEKLANALAAHLPVKWLGALL